MDAVNGQGSSQFHPSEASLSFKKVKPMQLLFDRKSKPPVSPQETARCTVVTQPGFFTPFAPESLGFLHV
jgi:hypothetical protein